MSWDMREPDFLGSPVRENHAAATTTLKGSCSALPCPTPTRQSWITPEWQAEIRIGTRTGARTGVQQYEVNVTRFRRGRRGTDAGAGAVPLQSSAAIVMHLIPNRSQQARFSRGNG